MTDYLYLIGSCLAVMGAMISVIGAIFNNIWHDHSGAMQWWMISNILLLVWAAGLMAGIWNGGLSALALVVMYLIFAVSNYWGMTHG